jgi:hypothetical protein
MEPVRDVLAMPDEVNSLRRRDGSAEVDVAERMRARVTAAVEARREHLLPQR